MPGVVVQNQNRMLQKYAKVPVFIACNTENGGKGACANGTYIGSGIKIGATQKAEHAYNLGKFANVEARALGCNMAFSPVCDIHYNWENQEIINRAFGNDVERVATMSKAYMDGLHTVQNFSCVAKHFPGNGQDFRDAHLSNNINEFGEEQWMETYGHVYKTLIEGGLDGIMGGHIMMPTYMREQNPDIKDEEMLPATLCPEIMTGLLREKLGFNGMVVTDASHMVAMTSAMKRSEMLPTAIAAGCDLFLFFNDPDEDFGYMMDGYKNGIITDERLEEALTRILGIKASLGLHKKAKTEIMMPKDEAMSKIGLEENKAIAKEVADKGIVLVKNTEDIFPISLEKHKRVLLVEVKGPESAYGKIMAAMSGGKKKPIELMKEKLEKEGFEVEIFKLNLLKLLKPNGVVITNIEDYYGKKLVTDKSINYGLHKGKVMTITFSLESCFTKIFLKNNDRFYYYKIPFVGVYNIYNFLIILICAILIFQHGIHYRISYFLSAYFIST